MSLQVFKRYYLNLSIFVSIRLRNSRNKHTFKVVSLSSATIQLGTHLLLSKQNDSSHVVTVLYP